MRAAIIPCSKEKIWDLEPWRQAVPAGEAYISEFHILCREYAIAHFDRWFILSAKYGLLLPTDSIPATYDITFDRPSDPVICPKVLAAQIQKIDAGEVMLLLPPDYAERVRSGFEDRGVMVCQPFVHMTGIDEICDHLKAWITH